MSPPIHWRPCRWPCDIARPVSRRFLLPQPHGFEGVVAVGEQSANPPRANAADVVIGTAGSSRFARPAQAVPVPAMPENGPRTDNLRARAYQGVVRHGFRRARPPIA